MEGHDTYEGERCNHQKVIVLIIIIVVVLISHAQYKY